LLERTERAEELAGVLAHELQHVLHRHVTRALVQHASTGLLITALTGDVTGALGYGLEAARTLGRLRYSRQAEEEADADGLRMMVAAGVDPAGMLTFFEKLRKSEKEVPKALTYLSTHPSSEHRLARLRALAAEASASATRPLLPDYDWKNIKGICATTG
jgi:predicted Zn-dependent protease